MQKKCAGGGTTRQKWDVVNMSRAVMSVRNGDCSQSQASKVYNVPRQTLQRYLLKDELKVPKLGRKPEMGVEAENDLERYLILRQEFGFGLTRTELRCLAFDFMEKLGVDHRFSKVNKMAGWEWMYSFLKRHPRLTVRKEENLSINRALGMNRNSVRKFFEILENKMTELNLRNKPDRVFNADESGLQMNTRGSHVLCQKGKKNVHSISPKEKGETVTVLACCNASGNFMPPSIIFKGKRIQVEYQVQLPPGSHIYTSDSGYINSEIFFNFIKEFITFFKISRADPAVLVVDGHDSHSRNIDMLEHCVDNGLTLLCLPPHTTHWLQPTDKSFFKPLKKYYYEEAAAFVRNHGRSFTKIEFCSIMCKAWMKSATAGNAVNGFRATGIWPTNMGEIPDCAYIGDSIANPDQNPTTHSADDPIPGPSSRPTPHFSSSSFHEPVTCNISKVTASNASSSVISESSRSTASLLKELSPVPTLKTTCSNRGKRKNIARELTSAESLASARKRVANGSSNVGVGAKRRATKSAGNSNVSCLCPVCGGNYYDENQGQKWVQCCGSCSSWFHEECVELEDNSFYCNECRE